MKKYLRTDLLKPCDVILTRIPQKGSKIVSKYSGGKYSHAAFVINGSVLFEAMDDGTLFTPLLINRAEYWNDGYALLMDVSKYREINVYRHPKVNDHNVPSQSRMLEIVTEYLGKQYPSYLDLNKAASRWKMLRIIAQPFLYIAEKTRRETPINPGPFCSKLVAEVFTKLGIGLFNNQIESEAISPNMLAESQLKPVIDVIVNSNPDRKNDLELIDYNNRMAEPLAREAMRIIVEGHKHLVQMEKLQKAMDEFIEAYKELLNKAKDI